MRMRSFASAVGCEKKNYSREGAKEEKERTRNSEIPKFIPEWSSQDFQSPNSYLGALAPLRLGERYSYSSSFPRSPAEVTFFLCGLRPKRRPVKAAIMTNQKPKPTMARFSMGKSGSGER